MGKSSNGWSTDLLPGKGGGTLELNANVGPGRKRAARWGDVSRTQCADSGHFARPLANAREHLRFAEHRNAPLDSSQSRRSSTPHRKYRNEIRGLDPRREWDSVLARERSDAR